MFVVSGLAAILFFGGWHGPIPLFESLAYQVGETDWRLGGYVANLAGCLNFILKSVIGVTVMMWVRWTLPRLRIDQVITMCWKYCVPIAAFCFVGALAWQTLDLPTPVKVPRSTIRETWAVEQLRQEAAAPQAPAESGRSADSRSGEESPETGRQASLSVGGEAAGAESARTLGGRG